MMIPCLTAKMKNDSPITLFDFAVTENRRPLGYQNGTDARIQRRQTLAGLPPRIECLDPPGYWRPPADGGPAVVFYWVPALSRLLTLAALFFAGCVVTPNLVAHVMRTSQTFSQEFVVRVVCRMFQWLPALGIFAPFVTARTWTLIRSYRRGPWIRRTDGGIEFPTLGVTVAAADCTWSVQSEQFRDGEGQTIRRSIVRVTILQSGVDVTVFYGRSGRGQAIRLADGLERFIAGASK